MVFDQQLKEALAAAARVQLHARIEAYTGIKPCFDYSNRYLIDKNFTDFFSAIKIPDRFDARLGLVTSDALTRKEFGELAEYKFPYGGSRECPPLMEFYPRGVIISSRIEEDRISKKTIADKIKAEAVRASKRLGRIFTLGRRGQNVFKSEDEYRRLLGKQKVYEIMKNAIDRKVEYLALARCDFYLPNLNSEAKGWVKKWSQHHKLPILIVPGITTQDLEALIKLEKERLKLV